MRTVIPSLPDGATTADRITRRDTLDEGLAQWTGRHERDDAVAALVAAGVRAVAGHTYGDVFRTGVLEERGMVERLDHPVTGNRPYAGLPVRIDGRPWRSRRPAACFAEHTDDVLRHWLDVPADRLGDLRAAEVIGTTPGRRGERGK